MVNRCVFVIPFVVLALAAILAVAAPECGAQETALDPAGFDALSAYTERDYGRAIELYQALAGRSPQDATYPFMLAKCYNRTGRPQDALLAIERAVANGATFTAVDYERGRAYYLLGRDQDAVAAFSAYHGKVPGDAISNAAFAEALVAVGRHQDALDRLLKVKPPRQLAFRHEVLLATAEAGLDRTGDALARLDRLSGQPLDLESRRFLHSLRIQIENKAAGVDMEVKETAQLDTVRPWNLWLTLGAEYDTNIPAHGERPRERRRGLRELDGWRGYAAIHGDYRYKVTDRFSVTGDLDLYGNRNEDLSEFDVHSVEGGITPEYRVTKHQIFLGMRNSFNRTWLNSSGFQHTIGFEPYLYVVYSPYTATKVSVNWKYENFFRGNENNPLEDLDNRTLRLQLAQEVLVKDTSLVMRGGMYWEKVSADGSDFDHDRRGVFFGFGLTLPWEVYLSGRMDYSVTNHESINSRSLPPDTRGDNDVSWGLSLSRELVERVNLSIYYTGYDEESNIEEFEYDRSIWGMSATYRF